MADTTRSYARRNQSRGQIAVFLLLVMAALFLFTLITVNIGEMSRYRTIVSNATDASAMRYASKVSSYAWYLWVRTLRMMKVDENSAEAKTFEVCKWDWKTFFTVMGFIALIIISIIPGGAAFLALFGAKLFAALGFGFIGSIVAGYVAIMGASLSSIFVSAAHDGAVLSSLQSQVNVLPPKTAMAEDIALFGLSQVVDDPKILPDIHDINKNGRTDDYVGRFGLLYQLRLKKLASDYILLRRLADAARALYGASDDFRKDWGGNQEFPELQWHPEWIPLLRAKDYSVPDNNLFYPQDGEAMKLLNDFMGYRTPRVGCGTQQYLRITNVNISRLSETPPVLTSYPEEIKYFFPFWNPPSRSGCCGGEGPPESCWPSDLPPGVEPQYDPPCDLGGLGENDTMSTPIDEVDYAVWTLATYGSWAWGAFDVDYDLPEYDETALKFNTAWTRRTTPEIARGFNAIYRQLYNVDGVPDEDAKGTWFVQFKDVVKKVISDPEAFQPDKCGWFKEIDKVLREKQFFGPLSDFPGMYSGLGKLTRTMVNDTPWPYSGGKRRELMEKINRICDRLTPLIPEFNGKLCPDFAWGPLCGGDVDGGEVDATTALELETGVGEGQACRGNFDDNLPKNTDCPECYSVARMQAIVDALNNKITEVTKALTTLQDAQARCVACCDGKYNTCMTLAREAGDACRGGCPDDNPETEEEDEYEDCISSCNSEQSVAEGICEEAHNSCLAGCATLQPAIDCRVRELRDLGIMLMLAENMLTLANTLQTVEGWITAFESREFDMYSLWIGANGLLRFIRNNDGALRALDRQIMFGQSDELPDVNYDGATLVSRKVGNGTEFEYRWPTRTNDETTEHSVKIWMTTDFKLPSVQTHKCALIFGRGARLRDYRGPLAVEMTRWDGSRNLIMRVINDWFFRANTTSSRTSAEYHADVSQMRVTPER